MFGRLCLLSPRNETRAPHGSRNKKGASIKNADKVTKHSCVSALFIFARGDAEDETNQKNERAVTSGGKTANFQTVRKFNR